MSLEVNKSADLDRETRRDFLRAAPARVIAFFALIGEARTAFARQTTREF